jgi:hypothetical protein
MRIRIRVGRTGHAAFLCFRLSLVLLGVILQRCHFGFALQQLLDLVAAYASLCLLLLLHSLPQRRGRVDEQEVYAQPAA